MYLSLCFLLGLTKKNEQNFFLSFFRDLLDLCNGRGLGHGLEAGPMLDKRGSPRGLVYLVSRGWSL